MAIKLFNELMQDDAVRWGAIRQMLDEYDYAYDINQAQREGQAEGEARGRAEGQAQGRSEGEATALRQTARKMRELCIDPAVITTVTGLDRDTILGL